MFMLTHSVTHTYTHTQCWITFEQKNLGSRTHFAHNCANCLTLLNMFHYFYFSSFFFLLKRECADMRACVLTCVGVYANENVHLQTQAHTHTRMNSFCIICLHSNRYFYHAISSNFFFKHNLFSLSNCIWTRWSDHRKVLKMLANQHINIICFDISIDIDMPIPTIPMFELTNGIVGRAVSKRKKVTRMWIVTMIEFHDWIDPKQRE